MSSEIETLRAMVYGATAPPTCAAIRAHFDRYVSAAYLSACGGELRHTYSEEAALRDRRRCLGRPCRWWAFAAVRKNGHMIVVEPIEEPAIVEQKATP